MLYMGLLHYSSSNKPDTPEDITKKKELRKIKGDLLKAKLQNIIHKMPSESLGNDMLEEYKSFNNQFESLKSAVIKFYINESKPIDQTVEMSLMLAKSSYANINVAYQIMVAVDEISAWRDELSQNKNKPLSESQRIHNKATLIRLTEVCSRLELGLVFVKGMGETFQCDMWNPTGQKNSVSYDIVVHKENMNQLGKIAPMLKGAGWKTLRTSLLILAGAMITAIVILAAITGVSAGVACTLGSAAILTAGVGFFMGKDSKVAGATHSAKDALSSKELNLSTMRYF